MTAMNKNYIHKNDCGINFQFLLLFVYHHYSVIVSNAKKGEESDIFLRFLKVLWINRN